MRTQVASHAEFALLKADDEAKIVVEIAEASGRGSGDGLIRGTLLEKQDETHYTRTTNQAEVGWGKETGLVMGKAEDIHAKAIVHVTGKMSADRILRAKQIVILTGYVQVK